MKKTLAAEVALLEKMSISQLVERFEEVFGEQCRSRHKHYLIRRIAWRLQANSEGGLSERARQRAEELASDSEIRMTPHRPDIARPAQLRSIQGAANPSSATIQDVRVDHGRAHIFVAKQFLDRSDVVVVLE